MPHTMSRRVVDKVATKQRDEKHSNVNKSFGAHKANTCPNGKEIRQQEEKRGGRKKTAKDKREKKEVDSFSH